MKEKMMAVCLAAAMAVMLIACSGSDTQSADETAASAETSAETSDAQEEIQEDTQDDTAAETADEEEITFESLTVMDNEEVSIIITGIETDGLWGYFSLNAELENKSDDVTYMFSVEHASVNGLMSDPFYASEVTAGNKSVDTIDFDMDTLEGYGIDQITDIEITFLVYDSDTWEDLAEETVHVYPYGEENASVYERTAQDTDLVLIDNDEMSLTLVGAGIDELWDSYTLEVYLVNKTDTLVVFGAEDAAVNGYMSDPYWADEAAASKTLYSTLYWDLTSLEDLGITDPESEIETIELTMLQYDYDTYDTLSEETITVNP